MSRPHFKLTLPPDQRQALEQRFRATTNVKDRTRLQVVLQAGQWRTAGQVREWLAKPPHIQRAERAIYYWLGKWSGGLRVPRPGHVKRDPDRRRRVPGRVRPKAR